MQQPQPAHGASGQFRPQAGRNLAALNLTGTTMRVVHSEYCPDIGPICSQRAEPPQLHDQRFYIGELRPVASVGITKIFGAELQAPLRLLQDHDCVPPARWHAFRAGLREHSPPQRDALRLRRPLAFRTRHLVGRRLHRHRTSRTGLPLGSTEEDPFARGRAGLPHQHIQFGTGTFYPVLRSTLARLGSSGSRAMLRRFSFYREPLRLSSRQPLRRRGISATWRSCHAFALVLARTF